MVIDINRCVGCQTCTIACKHANDTPPGVQWRSVLDIEHGVFPNVQREFLVTGCQHCAEPSCVPVCPSGATRQREDGMVTMDYDLCIGCGYCAVSCPYQARTIEHRKQWYFGEATNQEQAVGHDERIGVAQKCTFCIERVDEGLEHGATPGVDLDYTPACAASCIAQAISFGDFNDPDSNISRLIRDNASFQMHAELGNDPQIKYLYELPTTPGHDISAEDTSDDILGDPANPLTGKRQTLWDFRAATNFTLGGMGSGLAFLAMVFYFVGLVSAQGLVRIYLVAGIFILTGLTVVLMEIGRKFRFLHALLRPQTSWLTRETYCAGVFFPALILDWFYPQEWLHYLIGIAALGFLICQARILYAGKGIPAWRAPLIPWLLVATGLLEGSGLLLMVHLFNRYLVPYDAFMAWGGVVCAVATGALWISYRRTAGERGIPPLARAALGRVAPAVSIIGHILPLAGFFALTGFITGVAESTAVAVAAAAGAVLGGVIWKFTVIIHASYQQGFAIPKLPQRGSGTRAAPVREGMGRLHAG
jgi:phenylacetyl-CoA:acceptor oxidoreductase subunit 1